MMTAPDGYIIPPDRMSGRDYFVAPPGDDPDHPKCNDDWDGLTPATAWCTLTRVGSEFQPEHNNPTNTQAHIVIFVMVLLTVGLVKAVQKIKRRLNERIGK